MGCTPATLIWMYLLSGNPRLPVYTPIKSAIAHTTEMQTRLKNYALVAFIHMMSAEPGDDPSAPRPRSRWVR